MSHPHPPGRPGDPDGAHDLDRRLRDALRGGAGSRSGPGATRELLAALRRRRARRRLTLLGAAAAVVLAGGAAAYAVAPRGPGPTTAAGPPAATPTTAPAARGGGTAVNRPSSGATRAGDGSVPARGLTSCVRVRVQGSPARCAGAYAGETAGLPGALGASAGPSFGVESPEAAHAASGASVATEQVRPGETVTVDLPPAPGLAWGPVHASGRAGSGGAAARAAVLRPARAAGGRAPGRSPATFVAAHRGVATLRASAHRRCGDASGTCPATGVSWSVRVVVAGP